MLRDFDVSLQQQNDTAQQELYSDVLIPQGQHRTLADQLISHDQS